MLHTAIIAFVIIGMMFFLTNNEVKHESEIKKVEVHEKKIVEHQKVVVKSTKEENSTSKVDELLIQEQGLKDAAIYKNKILAKKIDVELEHEEELKKELAEASKSLKALENNNTELKENLETKIAQLLTTVDETKKIAKEDHEAEEQKLEALRLTKVSLESNLTAELEHEKALKIELEEASKSLKALENNNTQLKKENSSLKLESEAKIAKLLTTVDETKKIAKEDHEAEEQKLEALRLTKANLESNLTAELEHEKELELKVSELFATLKDTREKAKVEHELELQKIQTLSITKESLESNLTVAAEHEKELQAKITQLLATVNETTEKAKVEHSAEVQKLEALRLTKANLESNLTAEVEHEKELELKVSELFVTLKDTREKAKVEHELEAKKLETLLLTKVNLESNLTAEVEHEKLLTEENIALKLELESMAKAKEEAEKAAAEAKAKEEAEKAAVEAKAQADKAAVAELKDAFALTQVEFHNNSMNLTAKSKELLSKTAEVIKKHTQFQYVVQGHTDNRGNAEYNLQLSAKRANKVKEYLITQGVEASLLSSEGFGEEQPIADNTTKAGRIQNRRVVFQVIK